jgi:hypothetical protein
VSAPAGDGTAEAVSARTSEAAGRSGRTPTASSASSGPPQRAARAPQAPGPAGPATQDDAAPTPSAAAPASAGSAVTGRPAGAPSTRAAARAPAALPPAPPASDRPGEADRRDPGRPGAAPRSERPARPESTAGASTGSRPAAGGSVEDVLRRWPDIVSYLSRRPPLRPLVVECRPIQVDGGTIVLGFPEEKAFLRDVAERRRLEIEDGMAVVLGRPVSVRCVTANLDGYPPLSLDPEGARILAEARRIFGDDLVDVGEIT